MSRFTTLKGRSDDWFRRVGDHHRYLSEVVLDDSRRKEGIEKSLVAYKHASDLAISKLQAAHPIRLRLALNYSSFLYEVLGTQDEAVHVAQQALGVARNATNKLSQKDKNDSIQLLHDTITRWTSNRGTFHAFSMSRLHWFTGKVEPKDGQGTNKNKDAPRTANGDLSVHPLAGDLISGRRLTEKSNQTANKDPPVNVHQPSSVAQKTFPNKKMTHPSAGMRTVGIQLSQIIKEGLPRKRRMAKEIAGGVRPSHPYGWALPRKRVKGSINIQSG